MAAMLGPGLIMTPPVAAGPIFSGQLLTNFASATFSAPSGVGLDAEGPGFYAGNIPRSQTAWVVAGCSPSVCLRSWKQAWPALAAPGAVVTFRISVSNCAGYSAFNVTVTDMLPGNTTYAGNVQGWSIGVPGTWSYDEPPVGQGAPFQLQWQLNVLDRDQSACIEYTAEIL